MNPTKMSFNSANFEHTNLYENDRERKAGQYFRLT
ncbi:hypothetical protein AGR1C_pAt40077 [Agrobacterium fabacearum TT111]|nr:hypothetical protein AGR1C_pAt40077 [Agrobacterium fabacearum TT111]